MNRKNDGFRNRHQRYNVKNKKRRHKERADYHRLHTYGITVIEYEQKFAQQSGVCAICHQPETRTRNGKLASLCVDHDHQTNKVRQLLCFKCNFAIGLMDENVDRLRAAATYLEKHNRE